MRIIKKFPANPNMVIFLLSQQQTTKMSESFTSLQQAKLHHFAHYFFQINGVRRVQITRYEIRIYKNRDLQTWNVILPQILQAIKNIFPQHTIVEYANEMSTDTTRTFSNNEEICGVYEGVEVAEQNTFAKLLFCVEGIERVIVRTKEIEVKRSIVFSGEEVWCKVSKIIK
ncbi:NifU N-terminal domain-containing protein [Candidatus Uabimicrobium sp. HlEnr_7]|uniref:NifU N-terminal domain-containing protein n=1 Tax=Candidatus Uabimicrobium helgolandensis TaxID=3095367 RepID=UPI0035588E47